MFPLATIKPWSLLTKTTPFAAANPPLLLEKQVTPLFAHAHQGLKSCQDASSSCVSCFFSYSVMLVTSAAVLPLTKARPLTFAMPWRGLCRTSTSIHTQSPGLTGFFHLTPSRAARKKVDPTLNSRSRSSFPCPFFRASFTSSPSPPSQQQAMPAS